MTEEEFDGSANRWIRALDEWARDRLPYRSLRTSLMEAFTGTYWMFRMGPRHCWAFGRGFAYGRAKLWQREHPLLWRYFHVMQFLCKLIHSKRDRQWGLELERKVFGEDNTDS